MINTRTVAGRRSLRFESLAEVLQDAEQVASVPHRNLGNWSTGQIFQHLAKTIHTAIDGMDYRPFFLIRWGALLVKNSFFTKTMRPGFRAPQGALKAVGVDDVVSTEDGLSQLREAIERFQTTPERADHMVFGYLTESEHEMIQLRHAELHLSFIVPEEPAADDSSAAPEPAAQPAEPAAVPSPTAGDTSKSESD